jgi:hypothetical protein
MLGLGGFLFTFHYHYHACTVAPPLSPLPHITFKILYIIYIITAKQPNKYVIISLASPTFPTSSSLIGNRRQSQSREKNNIYIYIYNRNGPISHLLLSFSISLSLSLKLDRFPVCYLICSCQAVKASIFASCLVEPLVASIFHICGRFGRPHCYSVVISAILRHNEMKPVV